MTKLKLVGLDARRLADFERLVGGKDFGGCYCAVWNNFGPDWEARCKERPKENLAATEAAVRAGKHQGFLLNREDDGAYVAWTGAGPKTSFPYLKERPGSRLGPWDDSVWAVACLAIGYAHRGRGYSGEIVKLLAAEAKKAGAKTLEAYPIEPGIGGSEYRGTRKLYEAAGFTVAEGEPAGDMHALRMELKLS
ncbi:MAG: hypothetical protein HYZ75_01465 [Elusimicrobia bacterium]|nr:hypothetical protein [Elusimicrobiota bacterium]